MSASGASGPPPSGAGRLPLNLLANLTAYGASMLASLLLTPYLVARLGLDGYALVPLANALSAFMTPLTAALNTASARDLTRAIARDDDAATSVVFNSALAGTVCLCAVLAGIALPLASAPQWIFDLPPGGGPDAAALMQLSVCGFLLTTLASPFEMATYARNRFDVRSAIGVIGTIVRVGGTWAALAHLGPDPRYVGAGILAASATSAALSVFAWRGLLPGVRLRPRDVSADALRAFLRTGGWTLVLQLGTVLFLNVDVVLVNRALGVREGALYSLAGTWTTVLVSLSAVIGGVFGPGTIAAWARGDRAAFVGRAREGVRWVAAAMALPAALVGGFAAPLLRCWQGPQFEHLAPLMATLALPMLLTLPYSPLAAVFMATDRVRAPAIAQIVAGLLKVALAVVLMRYSTLGTYGMALAGSLLLLLRASVFTAVYAARLCDFSATSFLADAFGAALLGLITAAGAWGLDRLVHIDRWPALIAASAAVGLVYAASVYALLLRPDERARARGAVLRRLTARGAGGPA
jgi:O-antigen/teichoic acid export membrane protein